ncbi:M1 family metallopeptidase, partial [Ferruginibacter sp.]|uniref:M1 family metallopeptidase n=1 Tax=Ferruginibacter sp. TaxID=1940288 RepID=UPI00199A2E4D
MKLKITCLLFISLLFICFTHVLAQPLSKKTVFTHADTLRGSNGPGRNWWDVTKYDLHVKFNIEDSTIRGFNNIAFKVLNSGEIIQVDLQEPLLIDSIYLSYSITKGTGRSEKIEKFTREGNAYFIRDMHLDRGTHGVLTVYYHGKPTIAVRPPWDGGLIWTKDKSNSPWVSIACQGLGASVWYPCKDIQSDEPDSAEMHITCPDTLVCVGNGRLRGKIINGDGTATYDWAVVNPINNYCIIPYIGKYVHFGEIFKGEKGDLTMDYWVLDSNLDKAKKQFQDAPRMMKAFEYWFGPYPFYEDGYKLVDAPHLGMEHQSATAYGNGYQNGYHGTDLSGSGWGLKWDFIIVHESGHEWFGNNITSKDLADMWIHESFTNYSETLFTEYYYGKEAADAYVIGTRKRIVNDVPIIAPYGVNKEGSGDMYYKGGNMLHTIRQAINNDDL